MEQKTFSDWIRGGYGYDWEAAESFDPKRLQRVARYIATPRQGRRPIPEVCRQFEVEVTKTRTRVDAIAKLRDGTRIGRVTAYVGGHGYMSVGFASMAGGGGSLQRGGADDFSGCGIGTRLYEALAKYACKHRLKMTSDTTLYAPSQGFWDKQAEMGRAYFSDDTGRYVLFDACAASKNLSGLKIKTRRRRKG